MLRRSYERGVTLLDTIVGSALMLVVFVGVAAAFQLSVDVVTNNKARAGAIALADERMEYIRSLSYSSIGTVGGIPAGNIAQSETVALNGVSYTRRTTVLYGDDPYDGIGSSDTAPTSAPTFLDYKIARVDVAWDSRQGARHITLVTRIEPLNGIETPCSQCGTIAISVYNAATQPVSNAQVHVVNTTTNPVIDITTYTNTDGTVSIGGAPVATGYQVTVTKTGYSTDGTYSATSQNTNPTPGHLTVANNQTTSGTFRIDLLSSMTITTYSLSTNNWTDLFADNSKINQQTTINIEIVDNQARPAGNQPWSEPPYLLRSQTITPVSLSRWGTFSWNDSRPSGTTITYRVYYSDNSTPVLVPDSVLPGNGVGFSAVDSSIDLSSIPADAYPSLILEANFVAQGSGAPSIQDWSLTYESGQGIAIPFTMRGAKTIGSGPGGTVYKYDQLLTTNSSGVLSIPTIEWDTYTMTVDPTTNYDISSSCPTQPIALAPNTSVSTQLYLSLHTVNSLLVDVKNSSGAFLSGATVRLTKGGSYDKTIFANACGQAFFDALTNANSYSVTASKAGYATSTTNSVNVSGSSRLSVTLN